MRNSPEFAISEPSRETKAKRPSSMLKRLLKKVEVGALLGANIFSIGAAFEKPGEAAVKTDAPYATTAPMEKTRPANTTPDQAPRQRNFTPLNNINTRTQPAPLPPLERPHASPEQHVRRNTTAEINRETESHRQRMNELLMSLRESQPSNIEADVMRYYGREAIEDLYNNARARYAPETTQTSEVNITGPISFKGGSISPSQLREYLHTLPKGWENRITLITQSDGEKINDDGSTDIADVVGTTITFYAPAKGLSLQKILKTIAHEVEGHSNLGRFVLPQFSCPDGSVELSERVLYALALRLESPDKYNGGDFKWYTDMLKQKHSPLRQVSEYLATIEGQYAVDPRQLSVKDTALLEALIRTGDKSFNSTEAMARSSEVVHNIAMSPVAQKR